MMIDRNVIKASIDDVVLRWPSVESRRWLEGFIEDSVQDSNVVSIVAIGSAVRRAVSSDDLDLIVVCRSRRAFLPSSPLEVDLRVFQESEVKLGLEKKNDLLFWALKYGRVLLDRNRFWTRLSKAWQERIPLPDPEVARDRGAKALRHHENLAFVGDEPAALEMWITHLSHLARARLSELDVYPASRPELVGQLKDLGEVELAADLEVALTRRIAFAHESA